MWPRPKLHTFDTYYACTCLRVVFRNKYYYRYRVYVQNVVWPLIFKVKTSKCKTPCNESLRFLRTSFMIYFYYKINKNTTSLIKFPPIIIGVLLKNIEFLKMIISPLKRADSFLVEIFVCVCLVSSWPRVHPAVKSIWFNNTIESPRCFVIFRIL